MHGSLAGGQVIRDEQAEEAWAEFWAPDKSLADPPDFSLAAVWDSRSRGFTAWADTSSWVAGRWLVRGRVLAQTERGPAKGQSDPFPLVLRAA